MPRQRQRHRPCLRYTVGTFRQPSIAIADTALRVTTLRVRGERPTEGAMSADEFEPLADRADYYRQLATVIRSRASSMKYPEAQQELTALAWDYETLARYAKSTPSVSEAVA